MRPSSTFLRLSGGLALLAMPLLLGSRGCVPGESHERCPDERAPVCGVDGVTYDNTCEAEQAGVEVAYEGACGVACYTLYAPVCGTDGVTYPNDCYAAQSGATIAHEGECGVACYELYAPVCGTDGVTYPNDCYAARAGVEIAYPGGCACLPVLCDLDCPYGPDRDPMTGCEVCRCAPPPTPECVRDADCGDGQRCVHYGLACDCGPEGDCACPDVAYCEPIEPTHACWIDADCGEGQRCVHDSLGCDCGPGGDCACRDVTYCEPIEPTHACWTDADCGEGQYCALPEVDCYCADDAGPCTCPAVAGFCTVREDDPTYCRTDADCASDETCVTRAVDCACAPGERCDDCPIIGVCNPIEDPTYPPTECSTDADCAEGEMCIHHDCDCADGGPPGDPSDAGVPPPACHCPPSGTCAAYLVGI